MKLAYQIQNSTQSIRSSNIILVLWSKKKCESENCTPESCVNLNKFE